MSFQTNNEEKRIESEIEFIGQRKNEDKLLMKKVEDLRGRGLSYQAIADIELADSEKVYRIIRLFEGEKMEVLGVVNAYRRKRSKK